MTNNELRAATEVAKAFHEAYERLAPYHGYSTREDSAVPWEDVPKRNKDLMVHVCSELVRSGVLVATHRPDDDEPAPNGDYGDRVRVEHNRLLLRGYYTSQEWVIVCENPTNRKVRRLCECLGIEPEEA